MESMVQKCSYDELKEELFIEYNTYKDGITIKLDPWGFYGIYW